MSSGESKVAISRRQVLKVVSAGGLLGRVGKIPGWNPGENIAGPIAATGGELPSTAVPWYGQDLVRAIGQLLQRTRKSASSNHAKRMLPRRKRGKRG